MSVERARKLRKNLTKAEALLWAKLRGRQVDDLHFRSQHPVGPYVVDFACLRQKLVIEIDGYSHDARVAHDKRRSDYLNARGFRVIRFSNEDVYSNLEGVVETIRTIAKE